VARWARKACSPPWHHRRTGLYFLGLQWLSRLNSSFLSGVGDDRRCARRPHCARGLNSWLEHCVVAVAADPLAGKITPGCEGSHSFLRPHVSVGSGRYRSHENETMTAFKLNRRGRKRFVARQNPRARSVSSHYRWRLFSRLRSASRGSNPDAAVADAKAHIDHLNRRAPCWAKCRRRNGRLPPS